jgi:ribosomal protein S18 acetylase RimI-like enzyme
MLNDDVWHAISAWPYPDEFVRRLLQNNIPEILHGGEARMWGYTDPDGELVGFGVLELNDIWSVYTGMKHPYIPLLAVNPLVRSRGYGKSILEHLIDEATKIVRLQIDVAPVLFLDVYETSVRAIQLYERSRFERVITAAPLVDPDADGQIYFIMALRLN